MAEWINRSARKAENRSKLLRAARDLFAERGYWGVSLDEVADRAGLTKGAVYSNFESKEAMLLAVAFDQRVDLDPSQLPDPATPLPEQMRSVGRAVGRLAVSEDVRAIVPRELELMTLAFSSEHVRDVLIDAGREQRKGWASLLERIAGSQRRALPLPADEIAALLSAMRTGLMRMRILDPKSIPAHYFEDAFELIVTGHAHPARRPRTRRTPGRPQGPSGRGRR